MSIPPIPSPPGDVARRVNLQPDPSVLSAIGRGYTFDSAVADVVDNSIDAGASHVRIRFLVDDARLVGLRIRDDGTGMTAAQLHDALTLGKRRRYGEGALGHFGIGLKAASMGQCRTLTVATDCGFEQAGAMRLRRDDAGGTFDVDELTPVAAHNRYRNGVRVDFDSTGTVVCWDGLDGASASSDEPARLAWLDQVMASLLGHLGLVFHRIVAAGRVRIDVEQADARTGRSGVPRAVKPIDPFAFHMPGKTGYPTGIEATTASGARLTAVCHIVPPNARGPVARMLGRPRQDWQGFYVYRNDRLLQAGGWSSMATAGVDLQLARVAVDIDDRHLRDVQINPEKHGVAFRPGFAQALEAGVDDTGQITFRSFLDDARATLTTSNRRNRAARPVTPLGRGIPSAVTSALAGMVPTRPDAPEIAVLWRTLDEGRLFLYDHGSHTLWLNAGYRAQLTGSTSGGVDDAPLLKTAIALLFEEHFARGALQQSTLDRIEAYQTVLAAAMAAQIDVSRFDPLEDEAEDSGEVGGGTERRAVVETGTQVGDGVATFPADHGGADPAEVAGVRPMATTAASHETDDDSAPWADPDETEPVPDHGGSRIRGVSADHVRDYLAAAARVPLLDAEAEVDLARRVEAGVLAQERLDAGTAATRRERAELRAVVRRGRDAEQQFVQANLRLVVSIVKRHAGHGMALMDLIQEGNLGLIRAVQKFDYTKGFKFSTYATWWIRQSVTRALADQSRTVRLPVHLVEQIDKLRAEQARLERIGASDAAVADIARAVGIDAVDAQHMLDHDREPLSLDLVIDGSSPSGLGRETVLGDLIEDELAGEPEDLVVREDERGAVRGLIAGLSERDADILRSRFGIGGIGPMTLDDIGDRWDITRERVRQIVSKRIAAWREPSYAASLAGLLGVGAGWQDPACVEPEVDGGRGVAKATEAEQSASRVATPAPAAKMTRQQKAKEAARLHWAAVAAAAAAPADSAPGRVVSTPDDWSAPAPVLERRVTADASAPAPRPLDPRRAPRRTVYDGLDAADTDVIEQAAQDVRMLIAYRETGGVGMAADAVGVDPRMMAERLAWLLLGVTVGADDETLAPQHGLAYTPDERGKLITAFKRGQDVTRIAADFGRTPLAVAWQLLDAPGRLVPVTKRVLKDARRAARGILASALVS